MSLTASEYGFRSGGGGALGPRDDRPLSEEELRLVQRLLSDPLAFPIDFKQWLVAFIESSEMTLPTSAIQGLNRYLGIGTPGASGVWGQLPAGLIFPYGGDAAPAPAKMCNGTAYSRVEEKRLFDAIGTKFGTPPDSNTFLVPDMQERIPVGRGTMAGYNTVGLNENQPVGQRGTKHRHTVNDPGHGHVVTMKGDASAAGYNSPQGSADDPNTTVDRIGSAYTGITVGPAGVPLDGPAYLTLNFIITA